MREQIYCTNTLFDFNVIQNKDIKQIKYVIIFSKICFFITNNATHFELKVFEKTHSYTYIYVYI